MSSVPTEVEVRRVLPAPVPEVFLWWTEPALIARWMAPVGTAEAEVDLRVGGSLRIVMKDGDVEIEHRGEYLEVDSPHRLVFTWHSRYTGGGSLVTVSLLPSGEHATLLSITHSRLPEGAVESHQGGWSLMLERLAGEISLATP